jgi:hypothetical protein
MVTRREGRLPSDGERGWKLAPAALHWEAAFYSQSPRRPIDRQAYGAYPARVNLSRFCMWDPRRAVLLQRLRRFRCKCHRYNPAD